MYDMADIEKVIKGLECCSEPYVSCVNCSECPYYNDNENKEKLLNCNDILCKDAMELLKKQVPIQVKDIAEEIIGHKPKVKVGHCPCCGQLLSESSKYCNQCGQAVKWDEVT